MTMTDVPKAAEERRDAQPGGAGVGVWVITSFIALVALAVSVAALVVSVSHETKKVVSTVAAPQATPGPAGGPTVQLTEYKVGVGASAFKPGTVNFTITNAGTVEHELLVFRTDMPPAAFPVDPEGDINEEAPGLNKISDGDNIAPGGTQARSIDLSQPGTYVFVCNLPGHFKAGMSQVITVR
jgi:uncharacterized cupredoxin-like copper-binding protein